MKVRTELKMKSMRDLDDVQDRVTDEVNERSR